VYWKWEQLYCGKAACPLASRDVGCPLAGCLPNLWSLVLSGDEPRALHGARLVCVQHVDLQLPLLTHSCHTHLYRGQSKPGNAPEHVTSSRSVPLQKAPFRWTTAGDNPLALAHCDQKKKGLAASLATWTPQIPLPCRLSKTHTRSCSRLIPDH
jgi:hypothetical protein